LTDLSPFHVPQASLIEARGIRCMILVMPHNYQRSRYYARIIRPLEYGDSYPKRLRFHLPGLMQGILSRWLPVALKRDIANLSSLAQGGHPVGIHSGSLFGVHLQHLSQGKIPGLDYTEPIKRDLLPYFIGRPHKLQKLFASSWGHAQSSLKIMFACATYR
jgi:hypothetical protein